MGSGWFAISTVYPLHMYYFKGFLTRERNNIVAKP
jgi:hypothetical protein